MMRNFFRRNRPAHRAQPVTIAPEDRLIAAYSGFDEAQWLALPELAKADCRENIVWRML